MPLNLEESKIFGNIRSVKKYTRKDAEYILYLIILSLELIRKDSKMQILTRSYARAAIKYGDFITWRPNMNDLYQVLHVLTEDSGLKDNSPHHNINLTRLIAYIREYGQGLNDNQRASREVFALERELGVDITNYKSMRRLLAAWDEITKDEKALVVTRLLQAIRVRMPSSDIRVWVEKFAKNHQLELKNVINAEVEQSSVDVGLKSEPKKGWGTLKKIALGAGIGIAIATMRNKKK